MIERDDLTALRAELAQLKAARLAWRSPRPEPPRREARGRYQLWQRSRTGHLRKLADGSLVYLLRLRRIRGRGANKWIELSTEPATRPGIDRAARHTHPSPVSAGR